MDLRSDILKKDVKKIKQAIESISMLSSQNLKNANGEYFIKTEKSIRELLWLEHNFKKWIEIYEFEDK